MKRQIPIMTENIPFDCSKFAPHDGPFMLDNVVITASKTMLYFTEDLGTIIKANPIGINEA
jgi:hypothetical protein